MLSCFKAYGRFSIQGSIRHCQPNFSGLTKTIPHLETVAGLASARSSTSNIIVIWGVSLIISPDIRHSFLLSSSTVLRFSIQTASTGPSSMIQLLCLLKVDSLTVTAKIPSCQSLVTFSKSP